MLWSDGDAQDELLLLLGKAVNAAVFLHDGADAAHTQTVARLPGHRHAVLKQNGCAAGICQLQEKTPVLLVGGCLNVGGEPGGILPLAGMQGVFQRVGQQHAQVAFRQRQGLRQGRADPEVHPAARGPRPGQRRPRE